MSQTFEELVCSELNSLYQGALFLHAGDSKASEALLLRMLARSFPRYVEVPPGKESAWLEGQLVSEYLGFQSNSDRIPVDSSSTEFLAPVKAQDLSRDVTWSKDRLFAAARDLPAASRAAVWLTLFRRWSYAESWKILRVSEEAFHRLLSFRSLLTTTPPGWSGPSPLADHNGTV